MTAPPADEIVAARNAEIVEAMRPLFERERLVTEVSGASASRLG